MRNRNFLAALLAAMLVLPNLALAQETFEGNVIAGDTVADVLSYVEYDTRDMVEQVRRV